jgi:hypothetical protein
MHKESEVGMEELYKTNKDFRKYVDRYMRNKDVTLEEVLSYAVTRLVAHMYVKGGENYAD